MNACMLETAARTQIEGLEIQRSFMLREGGRPTVRQCAVRDESWDIEELVYVRATISVGFEGSLTATGGLANSVTFVHRTSGGSS